MNINELAQIGNGFMTSRFYKINYNKLNFFYHCHYNIKTLCLPAPERNS